MGDRICIRLTGKDDVAPMFYGHWCGLRALKVMNETVRESGNGIANIMCNFIIRIMEGKTNPYNYYLYNDTGCEEAAADGDNWTWTFHAAEMVWTTTHPDYKERRMTMEEVDEIVRQRRPCLYRTCPCELYEKAMNTERQTFCEKAFYGKIKT